MRLGKGLGFAGALIAAALIGGAVIGGAAANGGGGGATSANAAPAGGGGVPAAAAPGAWSPAAATKLCTSFSNDFAKELGVEPSALVPAAKAAAKKTIDEAQASGAITADMAARLKERVDAFQGDVCAMVGKHVPGMGKGEGKGQGMAHGRFGAKVDGFKAAADALKLTPADLASQLRSGKSLDDIAKAQGVSITAVKDAVVKSVKTDLDAAVKAGKITQERADAILRTVEQGFDSGFFGEIHGVFGGRGNGHGWGHLKGGQDDAGTNG